MTIKTHCKDCIFAKTNNGIQNGCTLERAEKLGIDKIEDEAYILERFCNTYRPEDWLNTLDFDKSLEPEKVALDEVYPRIGFFVRLKTDQPEAIKELEKTIKSIAEINGGPSYVVVITDKVEYNEESWELLEKYLSGKDSIKYHVLQMQENPKQVMRLVDTAFRHAQNGWIMTTSSGCEITNDVLDKLHKVVNLDMKQLMLIEPYDGFNGMIFPAFLFKFLNGNRDKIFSDEMVDGRAFLEKVKAAEERGGTNHILKWEDFNAA